MFSVTSCVKNTPPDETLNYSLFGEETKPKSVITVLATITEDNEYESTDGYVPNPEPWDRAKETRCAYIARVGIRFTEDDYTP